MEELILEGEFESQLVIVPNFYYETYCIKCKHCKECNKGGVNFKIYEDYTDIAEDHNEMMYYGLECEFEPKNK